MSDTVDPYGRYSNESWSEVQARWSFWRRTDREEAKRNLEHAAAAAAGVKVLGRVPIYPDDRSGDAVNRIIRKLNMASWERGA